MFDTLKDPIQIFLAIAAVAVLLESLLHERYKERVRLFLRNVQERAVVPTKAIDIIDRIFGPRILSLRSIVTSVGTSIVGAAVTALLISLTSGGAINVWEQAEQFIATYPVQTGLFFVTFLAFDYLSYVATRVFVRIAAEVASLGRGVLMFTSDFLVSAAICIVGLASASTAMVYTLPTEFWPKQEEARPGSDILASLVAAVEESTGLHLSLTYNREEPILLPADMSAEDRRQFALGGMVSLLRRTSDHESFAPEVLLVLGEISEQEALTRLAAQHAPAFDVQSISCQGGSNEREHNTEYLRAIYGSGTVAPCPVPTPMIRSSPAIFNTISMSRADDIELQMIALYAGKLISVISTKLNEYASLTLPLDWANVLSPALYWDGRPWVVASLSDATVTPTRPADESQEADAGEATEGAGSHAQSQLTNDSGEEWSSYTNDYYYDTYYYGTYNVYAAAYPVFDETAQSAGGTRQTIFPISPLLGSALWLSLVFWIFVSYSLSAAIARTFLSLARGLLAACNWTNAPIQFVGAVVAVVLCLLIGAVQIVAG